MSYFWYIILVVIIYLIYKRLFSPIYESFKKGKQMINDLSVDDRHSNIQDMLTKQMKVFEGLKDDPDGMANELSNFDCVIFNPPRSGAKAQAKEISNSGVPIVIAVSCDPVSFARDSSILTDGCYFLEQVTPIDQFKFTRHVEMVAVFMKRESK